MKSSTAPTPPPAASRTVQLLLVVAAVAVALAVKVNDGHDRPYLPEVVLLAVAAVAGLAATLDVRVRRIEAAGGRLVGGTAAAGVVVCAVALCVGRVVPPSASAAAAPGDAPMHALLTLCGFPPPTDAGSSAAPVCASLIAAAALAAVAVLASLWGDARAAEGPRRRWGRLAAAAMPVALVLHLASLVFAVRAAPAPVMDVLVFQAASADSLIRGEDPYAIHFPDLSGGTSPHYGPGLQANGELLFGFPYPPLSLYWLLPAYLVGGAVQYAHAFAFTATAALVAYATRGPLSKAAALLFMVLPTGPLVVCYGWTETLVAPALALAVFVACRRRLVDSGPSRGGLLGPAVGLFWAAKQYVPLTAPLAWLFVAGGSAGATGRRRSVLIAAVGTAAAVSLPLVLWDVPAFWHSAVAVQFRQPFRPDALSFAAAACHAAGVVPPAWAAFLGLGVVQGLALWRSPRTPAAFAAATGTALLVFFALNKQAFAGYYFLVVAAYACALAAAGGSVPEVAATTATTTPRAPAPTSRRPGKRSRHAGV